MIEVDSETPVKKPKESFIEKGKKRKRSKYSGKIPKQLRLDTGSGEVFDEYSESDSDNKRRQLTFGKRSKDHKPNSLYDNPIPNSHVRKNGQNQKVIYHSDVKIDEEHEEHFRTEIYNSGKRKYSRDSNNRMNKTMEMIPDVRESEEDMGDSIMSPRSGRSLNAEVNVRTRHLNVETDTSRLVMTGVPEEDILAGYDVAKIRNYIKPDKSDTFMNDVWKTNQNDLVSPKNVVRKTNEYQRISRPTQKNIISRSSNQNTGERHSDSNPRFY